MQFCPDVYSPPPPHHKIINMSTVRCRVVAILYWRKFFFFHHSYCCAVVFIFFIKPSFKDIIIIISFISTYVLYLKIFKENITATTFCSVIRKTLFLPHDFKNVILILMPPCFFWTYYYFIKLSIKKKCIYYIFISRCYYETKTE